MENEEVVEVSPATDADLVIFSMAEMLHDQKLIVGLAKICETGKVEGKGVGWNGVGWRTGSKEYGSVYTRVAAAVLCGSSDSDPVPGTVVGQETKHRVTLRADRL